MWAIIIVVSCRQHTLHYSGRQFRMNFISTVAQWDKFFVFLVFIRFSLILKWHCLWWDVLKALNEVSLGKWDLKELLVVSYSLSFFFFLVELVWMFFDSWRCSKYYCIRNSKMCPCQIVSLVNLILLLTKDYGSSHLFLFLEVWIMRAVFAMVIFLVGQLHPSSRDSRLFSCFFCFLWINALEI